MLPFFYKICIQSWSKLQELIQLCNNDIDSILKTRIFCNSSITFKNKPLGFTSFLQSNLRTINDIWEINWGASPRLSSSLWGKLRCSPRLSSSLWGKLRCSLRLSSSLWGKLSCSPRLSSSLWGQLRCPPRLSSSLWGKLRCFTKVK
jgi:hypothetical protein